ncbi:putative xanthine dehydrogenase HxA [Basidiobolus meristosporus CBS 931.73]|uniref:xanthine dehydrogenase n=1 Tax=Basidiobolus meristosporus CBS 931.73 TaxID=1314790 RepID=A0A1Y1VRZ6_9FUNG|nr:putative xanthine dehydrogenase HxA [Basidiobolus meristosporus CBS 931.73]|eukprot:ORX63815.1 putative xanthine dehydrogenase HxA [Basidiobolus meristosporus CBS 931.73]
MSIQSYSNILTFYVNGTRIVLQNPDPEMTLLQYLRGTGLTGTKLGCGEGGCGACTLLVSSYDPKTKKITHTSTNACLAPLCAMDGKHVITIEGIGNAKNPHPVQERIALAHGSQCGFCTPGIAMSLYALLRNNPNPSEHDIEEAFDGNLCRCTGYRPILDAAKTFATPAGGCCGGSNKAGGCCQDQEQQAIKEEAPKGCGKEGGCCQDKKEFDDKLNFAVDNDKFEKVKLKKYDPSQELIFPPGLIKYAQGDKEKEGASGLKPLAFSNNRYKWYRPLELDELLQLKAEYPDAKIIAGNSEVGIEIKFKQIYYPVMIYVSDIEELKKVEYSEEGITFGANITLSNFERELKKAVEKYEPSKTENFKAYLSNLRWFAGRQIRNVGTIAGNIVTASPISDLNPVFVSSRAVMVVSSKEGGLRSIKMTEFFLGYRKTALRPGEVVVSLFVPFTKEYEFAQSFKQAKRKDDDIAIANGGLRVKFEKSDEKFIVKDIVLAFGGMGPTTLQAKSAMEYLIGKEWGYREDFLEVVTRLGFDLPIQYSSPGGMGEFRKALSASFFYKFWCNVSNKLGLDIQESKFADEVEDIERAVSQASQSMPVRPENVVGKGVAHLSALKQVTGEAIYVDDMPSYSGELYGALVTSKKARAKILNVDAANALQADGVVGFYSAKDVPGNNTWGPVFQDEEVFASTDVYFLGQIIGIVVAKSQNEAQAAARMVNVEYEDLPHILTIEEAIEKESFVPAPREIIRGDVDEAFKNCDHVFEGETKIGGQEHFYLETNACIVVPKEGDEIEIFSSTQNPTETQHVVAKVLDCPDSRVIVRTKRLGGGFGGKESRTVMLTAPMAVAAHHLRKPIRVMLDRDEDMLISGQRHPFLGRWKVGVNKDGKLQALDVKVYANAGWSADLTMAVVERAMSHSDNCYWIPNVRAIGKACITNIHSNTAYRGFGGPQGMIICENWVHEVADRLNIPVDQFREINMYKEGQITHFNQELTDWHIPKMWKQIKESSNYDARRQAVDEFNKTHTFKKRGLAIIPTKFGISFTAKHLNQAGALVHVYTDGSVLLTHGGIEMGQGIHTKMAQIAAETLGVPLEKVYINETATNTVANTSPTAASAGSDLNGQAVKAACEQVADRLRPYREKMPDASIAELAKAAYFDRVNLSANGYYRTPDIGYVWGKNEGMMFFYFTLGIAVSEVEIDILTGDHTIISTDILMDVGKSLNYSIDLGQVEGAWLQGAGWSTMEETLFFPNGMLFTRGPGTYKIPGFRDIPQRFRVDLLDGVEYKNLKTIHGSKGIGEPPFFLGTSVYYAIRDAVSAARKDNGNTETFTLAHPATAEQIRMASSDEIATLSRIVPQEGEKPWAIRV